MNIVMKLHRLFTPGLLSLLARRDPKPGRFRHSALALFGTLCLIVAYAATGLAEDAPAPPATVYAKTIFFNGNVVTVNSGQPLAEALAVAPNGTILAVGDLYPVLRTKDPSGSTTLVDLKGHTLMPGFVEPHTHVIQTALDIDTHLLINLSSFSVPMYPGKSIPQIQQTLTNALPGVPEGEWLLAWGVDPSRSTPFMASLDAKTLDEVSTKVPIFVLNQSGHIAYVNTPAMKAAGIDGHTPDPEGGRYERKDEKCRPNKTTDCPLTGVLYEPPAYVKFQEKVKNTPSFIKGVEKMPSALAETYKRFAAAGVTTATELGVGTVTADIDQELGLLESMAKDRKTPLRIRAYLDWNFLKEYKGKRELQPGGESNGMLGIIGVKFYADGSTQGLTAALKTPYDYQTKKDGDNRGELNYPEEPAEKKRIFDQLVHDATFYLNQGWQLAFHTNGDRATDQVLKIYDHLKNTAKHDPAKLRCRIEHLTVTEEKQLDKIKELGLTTSMTIGHPYFWGYAFGATEEESGHVPILGKPRAERIDPAKSLHDRGVRFSFNSDSPISPVDPLRYISTAVTRQWQEGPGQKGEVLGADQRISVDDAIRAVTLDAAYQLFLDKYVGSLEVGKLADLVILDKNPRTTEPKEDIMKIKVCSTYLSGVRKDWQGGANCPP